MMDVNVLRKLRKCGSAGRVQDCFWQNVLTCLDCFNFGMVLV